MHLPDYWSTVVDTVPDGILVVDDAGMILAVNSATLAMTGHREEDLLGRSCTVLNCTGCEISGEGRDSPWCSLFRWGEVVAKECFITTKNGDLVSVMKRASVIRDREGRVVGAVETLTDIRELLKREQEINSLRRTLGGRDGFHGMIGRSRAMQSLFELLKTVAGSDAPALITGESGSGKELAAGALHELGPRAAKPFLKVNCAALNPNLFESELFGHVKGAFTGADRSRVGRFEAADGGDMLLDEVGDIPLSTQVKLLRVIEEKEVERVGDHRPIKVDVRILAATNRNLEELAAQGRFREDLLYRINVLPVSVPPLRARPEDIPLLAESFITSISAKNNRHPPRLAPEAMDILRSHAWPGNVRELLNAMEYAVVICPGEEILPAHLPPRLRSRTAPGPAALPHLAASRPPGAPESREARGRRELVEILRQCGGNQSEAARMLGVSRVTIWNRIKRYGIDPRNPG